ncbi:MAG: 2-dehydropantoate 2-reductase [Vicinamibacterales bacterium]
MPGSQWRIGVVGAGGVGGFFGARLARRGHAVSFVARGAHLRAIRERGLAVWSSLGDFTVRAAADADPSAIGPVDLVLFTVKTYDNATAIPLIAPMVGQDTIVLTLQNGIDSVDEIAAIVGDGRVLGGSTFVAANIRAPGLIQQIGTHRSILFGEVFGARAAVSPRVEALAAVLADADIQVQTFADARVPLWEKFVYLVPFSGFTAAARLAAGPVWGDQFVREQFIATAEEVKAVARAEGVTFAEDFHERFLHYMDTLPGTVRSSMLVDVLQGKRIEVEAVQGALVRRAAKHGVPVPRTSMLYAAMKLHAHGRMT